VAEEYIEAEESIVTGITSGISAGLQITCKGMLKVGLNCSAGTFTGKEITDAEKTITCGKFEGGTLANGILKQTGFEE
jgi:hypothetical protein